MEIIIETDRLILRPTLMSAMPKVVAYSKNWASKYSEAYQ